MIYVLFFIGIATIIGGVIIGFLSGSVIGFLIALCSAISSAIILFALARILENQETIMSEIRKGRENIKKPVENIVCQKCNKSYEKDYSSCPHCGSKPVV